jgi:hypothetical protein
MSKQIEAWNATVKRYDRTRRRVTGAAATCTPSNMSAIGTRDVALPQL